jgi:hypothetical protein
MAIKTFTAGETLTATDTNTYLTNGGLVYIAEASTNNTVPSVNFVNCFSSTYDNYRIEIANIRGSSSNISFRMLTGTTPLTTATYAWGFVGISTLGVSTNYSANAQTTGLIAIAFSTTDTGGVASYDILNPYLARRTVLLGNMHHINSGLNGFDIRSGATMNENGISYNGIQILANAGNVTFVARIYGYRQA